MWSSVSSSLHYRGNRSGLGISSENSIINFKQFDRQIAALYQIYTSMRRIEICVICVVHFFTPRSRRSAVPTFSGGSSSQVGALQRPQVSTPATLLSSCQSASQSHHDRWMLLFQDNAMFFLFPPQVGVSHSFAHYGCSKGSSFKSLGWKH